MDKFNLLKVFRQSIIIHLQNDSRARKLSFTMAEILLSLTIIGVVAAITLPSLTGNINERTWNTQRKALYARMSQAIALMPNLNGYGIGATESETASNAAKAFVTNGLTKVYKINNICDVENIDKCGFPSKFNTLKINGSYSKIITPTKLTDINSYFNYSNENRFTYSQIDTQAVAFETANGESILAFYNPTCGYVRATANYYYGSLLQPTMCANFIYDLNAKKGPNEIGKDMGYITVFYPTDSVVTASIPLGDYFVQRQSETQTEFSLSEANKKCRKYNADSHVANIDELSAIFVNYKLTQVIPDYFISSTIAGNNKLFIISMFAGSITTAANNSWASNNLRNFMCVK